jgi:hypothetical protein
MPLTKDQFLSTEDLSVLNAETSAFVYPPTLLEPSASQSVEEVGTIPIPVDHSIIPPEPVSEDLSVHSLDKLMENETLFPFAQNGVWCCLACVSLHTPLFEDVPWSTCSSVALGPLNAVAHRETQKHAYVLANPLVTLSNFDGITALVRMSCPYFSDVEDHKSLGPIYCYTHYNMFKECPDFEQSRMSIMLCSLFKTLKENPLLRSPRQYYDRIETLVLRKFVNSSTSNDSHSPGQMDNSSQDEKSSSSAQEQSSSSAQEQSSSSQESPVSPDVPNPTDTIQDEPLPTVTRGIMFGSCSRTMCRGMGLRITCSNCKLNVHTGCMNKNEFEGYVRNGNYWRCDSCGGCPKVVAPQKDSSGQKEVLLVPIDELPVELPDLPVEIPDLPADIPKPNNVIARSLARELRELTNGTSFEPPTYVPKRKASEPKKLEIELPKKIKVVRDEIDDEAPVTIQMSKTPKKRTPKGQKTLVESDKIVSTNLKERKISGKKKHAAPKRQKLAVAIEEPLNVDDNDEYCQICHYQGEFIDSPLVCCETCPASYHQHCCVQNVVFNCDPLKKEEFECFTCELTESFLKPTARHCYFTGKDLTNITPQTYTISNEIFVKLNKSKPYKSQPFARSMGFFDGEKKKGVYHCWIIPDLFCPSVEQFSKLFKPEEIQIRFENTNEEDEFVCLYCEGTTWPRFCPANQDISMDDPCVSCACKAYVLGQKTPYLLEFLKQHL